jgi:hypothetical protein
MPHGVDRPDPAAWVYKPEDVAAWQQAQKEPRKPASVRQAKERRRFCMFPVEVLAAISKAGGSRTAVLGILSALYELWFKQSNRNPIQLTSLSLRKYGVSPDQKLRALQVLEKSGQISIDREPRKNPLVTLKWLPLKSEFER